LSIETLWRQTQSSGQSQYVSVHRHHRPAQREQQNTGNGLFSDPFELAQVFDGFIRAPSSEKREAQVGVVFVYLIQNPLYSFGFDSGQSSRSYALFDFRNGCPSQFIPIREVVSQAGKSPVAVVIRSILRKNRADQNRDRLTPFVPDSFPVFLIQKTGDSFDFLLSVHPFVLSIRNIKRFRRFSHPKISASWWSPVKYCCFARIVVKTELMVTAHISMYTTMI